MGELLTRGKVKMMNVGSWRVQNPEATRYEKAEVDGKTKREMFAKMMEAEMDEKERGRKERGMKRLKSLPMERP